MTNSSKPRKTIRIPQDPELRSLRSSLDEARQRHGVNSFEKLEILGDIEAFYEKHCIPLEALRTCDTILNQLEAMKLSKSDWAFDYLLRKSYYLLLLARPEEAELSAKEGYEGVRNLYGSCCTEILFALQQYLDALSSNGKTMSVVALGEKYLRVADELYRRYEPEWIRSRLNVSYWYGRIGRKRDARSFLLSIDLAVRMEPSLWKDIVFAFEDTYFRGNGLSSSPLPDQIRDQIIDLPVLPRHDPLSLFYTLLSVAAEHDDPECCALLCERILDLEDPACEAEQKRYKAVRMIRDALKEIPDPSATDL